MGVFASLLLHLVFGDVEGDTPSTPSRSSVHPTVVSAKMSAADDETPPVDQATLPVIAIPRAVSPLSSPTSSSSLADGIRKRSVDDFTFGKQLGEGSYSTVMQATEGSTGRQFAIKILDKKHIIKEKKIKYVHVEKNVLNKLNHPFCIRLFYTFQDDASLYFVLDLALNGELLDWIKKLGSFDENCARFYAAEILLGIEYLHSINIIHRDVKPENILLDGKMHIKLTDFGTAKILDEDKTPDGQIATRGNSFVGTAEYVSPELLSDKYAGKAADIWALGCILYQLLAGRPPFKGPNEYQTFQKISKLEFSFPEGFPVLAQDIVNKFLVLNPADRLGSGAEGYAAIKSHPFFEGIDWANLPNNTPPKLLPYLPAIPGNNEELRSDEKGEGLFKHEREGSDLGGLGRDPFKDDLKRQSVSTLPIDPERIRLLREQKTASKWAQFLLTNELIILSGPLLKRKGMFAKRRQFILTDLPRLIYIDEEKMVQKGEIPWSDGLKPELKNKRTFFIHTAKRTFYLEDNNNEANKWVDAIQAILK